MKSCKAADKIVLVCVRTFIILAIIAAGIYLVSSAIIYKNYTINDGKEDEMWVLNLIMGFICYFLNCVQIVISFRTFCENP
jgi:hypothetical protein